MIPKTIEEIQKLAEEKYSITESHLRAAYLGEGDIWQHEAVLNAQHKFIEGYTTCQQTEVAELQKRLESKNTSWHSYCQRAIEDETPCDSQCEHCKEYYAPIQEYEALVNLKKELDRVKGLLYETYIYMCELNGMDSRVVEHNWEIFQTKHNL